MKKLKIARRAVGIALLVLVLLFVDQLTKLLAYYYLINEPRTVTLIPGFLGLMYAENDAIAFNIGSGNRPFMIFVMILTAALIVGIVVLMFTVFKKNRGARIALCFIEAGAIGNFLDRLTVVGVKGDPIVRDFINMIDFKPLRWLGSEFNFGVCNVADFFIVFGAIALLVIILFIGPYAIFPATKKWRAESKAIEEEKERVKRKKSGK